MKFPQPKNPALDNLRPQRLAHKNPFVAFCDHVYDGDTIRVLLDDVYVHGRPVEIIRLAGIDAPELRGRDRCAALASREALHNVVIGQRVLVMPVRLWRCPYGRIIARVLVDDLDLGAWLVKNAWAREYRV